MALSEKERRFRLGTLRNSSLGGRRGTAARCPIPGAADGSRGRGSPSSAASSRGAAAGGVGRHLRVGSATATRPRAPRGAEPGGSGAGRRIFSPSAFFLFVFFFPPSQRLERIPQSRNPECWSGISANPECCKAVPADARGFAGVSGSELGQVLKQTCSEELGKLQQDMSCFGHGGPWAHHP